MLKFAKWMLVDIAPALRRTFWSAVIVGFFGGIIHKITRASEKFAAQVGVPA